MTDKQKEFFDEIKRLVDLLGYSLSSFPRKEFEPEMKRNKIRIPWQLIQHAENKGYFDFTEFFDEKQEKSSKLKEFGSKVERSEKTNTSSHKKTSLTQQANKAFFNNPVFIVESKDSANNSRVVSVSETFETAWTKKYSALHDNGKTKKEDAQKAVDKYGTVNIQSSNCNSLWCTISKMELIA